MTYYSSDSLDFNHDRLTLMGGLAGFSLGSWRLQKEQLAAARLEARKRQAALETLQQLMVTLPHHFRNANVVIGGFGSRLQKSSKKKAEQERLGLMIKASREIDAVINALENLAEVTMVQYIDSGRTKIIDLQKELDPRLANSRPLGGTHDGT